MRAPLSKCESPAYFFKFIKPGLNSQLSIPTSFRKYIQSGRNNKTVTLKRGSQKWSVKIIDWAFSEGWDKFVRENGVQDFDFVVFKHEGNMVFNTMVFDNTQSWCERECSNSLVTESSKKCKSDTNGTRILPNSMTLKKIQKEKDTNPDQNQHPYLLGTLRSREWKYRLYLPINFIRSNGLSTGEMTLRNGQSQRSWTVDLSFHSKRGARIGRGWHDFCIANGFKEGDHFKLELIQTGCKPIANIYTLKKIPKEKDANPDQSQHPYFLGTLKSTDWKYRLHLPTNFTRSNGLSTGEMILRNDQSQRVWTVDLKISSKRFGSIGRGWLDFCTANGLKEGDHFKFELIQTGIKPVAVFYNVSNKQSESHRMVDTPSFVGTLKEYDKSRKQLYIPKKFALENGLRGKELVLKNVENEGSWTVNLSNCLDKFYYIRSGLKKFCIANGLEKGDAVKFELIKNGKKPVAIISKNEGVSE